MAEYMNGYKTVVIYDPVDLSLIKHEFNEWGIEVKAKVLGFNEYLLSLIDSGKLTVKKSDKEYSLQDSFAYARELDDVNYGRKLIEKIGINKDVLLIRKEANFAGSLIMNEYMPDVIKAVACNRWHEFNRMNCDTVVTENPAEYELLKANVPQGKRVISIEQMIIENM
jgi:Fe-S oxidoreductase